MNWPGHRNASCPDARLAAGCLACHCSPCSPRRRLQGEVVFGSFDWRFWRSISHNLNLLPPRRPPVLAGTAMPAPTLLVAVARSANTARRQSSLSMRIRKLFATMTRPASCRLLDAGPMAACSKGSCVVFDLVIDSRAGDHGAHLRENVRIRLKLNSSRRMCLGATKRHTVTNRKISSAKPARISGEAERGPSCRAGASNR